MSKMVMAVAGLAMAVVLTGCGGSPKGVAEDFAEAIIKKDPDKAIACFETTDHTASQIKDKKEAFDKLGKKINDDKLDAVAIYEEVTVPGEDEGYVIVNGKKATGEKAKVTVQFVKGKDKKSDGMKVRLVKIDGSWKVIDYDEVSNLDTSDK